MTLLGGGAALGLLLEGNRGGGSSATAAGTRTDPGVHSLEPYISEAQQLDSMPWPGQSFYKQPWRAYLETVPATRLLSGIGVNYNLPAEADHAAVVAALANAGIRSVRLEIPWGGVAWDGSGFTDAHRYHAILAAAAAHGITPLILLNGHQGGPCPHQTTTRQVITTAPRGTSVVTLADVTGLVAGRSGLSNITAYWMAEVLFTAIDPATGQVTLSKPLPKDFPGGQGVQVDTLRYEPFHRVGSQAFEATAAGWVGYVGLAVDLLSSIGIHDFAVEVWNEVLSGSAFLSIENYYDPPPLEGAPDFMRRGGVAWEIGKRTVDLVGSRSTGRVIWGFSNTTFYHTPIDQLPPRTHGQSYHPYATSPLQIPRDFPPPDRFGWYVEGFPPPYSLTMCMPEGTFCLGVQTETLMRLLPTQRRLVSHPSGVADGQFEHVLSEHGTNPSECGITDTTAALNYKAKAAIRALVFWLGKGIHTVDYFSAYDQSDLGWGLLLTHTGGQRWDALASSPALTALQRTTSAFAGAVPVPRPRQIDVGVAQLGNASPAVFTGDAKHPDLPLRERIVVLPFQVKATRFVIAAYVMTSDARAPFPGMPVRVMLGGLASSARVTGYDPLADTVVAVATTPSGGSGLILELTLTDYPSLISIQE